jgi:S-DNA-T family DNA segregation ATPase FtsK/SpoIIIE
MATKKSKKSSAKGTKSRPKKTDPKAWKPEKEEKINLRQLARDERTWKITGAVSLLVSVFLFIAFISYFFTWKEDQAVAREGLSALWDNSAPVSNLLGRLGAVVSYFFIVNGFGIASLLICTFFFVVGINLLFNRKVFSIWRNLKYVTVGLVVLSVALAFIFDRMSGFPTGGMVGTMISDKMVSMFGNVGTAAVLSVVAFGYFIWQFNPAFNLPRRKAEEATGEVEPVEEVIVEPEPIIATAINGNILKGKEKIKPVIPEEEKWHDLKVIEKDEPEETLDDDPIVEKEIVNDLFHNHETLYDKLVTQEPVPEPMPEKVKREKKQPEPDLPLEIKSMTDEPAEEEVTGKELENLPPYEPTLDLRDYKYPALSLLETHGSEKIVQDANELENNKSQIIHTLRNYAIEIQKISATVGPTVTLYEIVPAAGVRISKIKNLEDDIALSLAALGIRIIAPIPGKGTIGIEVPNVKKTVVSMKTLLASEKFQHNAYSLPIAIGKKIDNDNFIVDLTSMPHLLMAGATGQGKSVGLNAILDSL